MFRGLRSRLVNRHRAQEYRDSATLGSQQVSWLARDVADDWKDRPGYYDAAEKAMERSWRKLIWPMIRGCDFSCVVDLAAGRGRNSVKLLPLADKLYIVDVNEENVRFCQRRFAGAPHALCLKNDGISLRPIGDGTISLVYCFDAMVHFDSDVVRAYLYDIARVLRPGGKAFLHHSNYDRNPTGYFRNNPGWRNFMSQKLFLHYCTKAGLESVESRVIDWEVKAQDALTLVQRPG